MVVGLTGGIGSGKSTVARLFSKFEGVAIYTADIEAKKLMNSSEEIREQLVIEFGEETFKNDVLNRPFLANIVFKSKEKLHVLNSIVHPVVHNHLKTFIAKNENEKYILYENAILFENRNNIICDKIITVTAPKHVRIQRVIERDKTTTKAVEERMNNQWSDEKKILQSNYIIHNLMITEVKTEVLYIHNNLTNILS